MVRVLFVALVLAVATVTLRTVAAVLGVFAGVGFAVRFVRAAGLVRVLGVRHGVPRVSANLRRGRACAPSKPDVPRRAP